MPPARCFVAPIRPQRRPRLIFLVEHGGRHALHVARNVHIRVTSAGQHRRCAHEADALTSVLASSTLPTATIPPVHHSSRLMRLATQRELTQLPPSAESTSIRRRLAFPSIAVDMCEKVARALGSRRCLRSRALSLDKSRPAAGNAVADLLADRLGRGPIEARIRAQLVSAIRCWRPTSPPPPVLTRSPLTVRRTRDVLLTADRRTLMPLGILLATRGRDVLGRPQAWHPQSGGLPVAEFSQPMP